MHIMNDYKALYTLITFHNVLYIKALSKSFFMDAVRNSSFR